METKTVFELRKAGKLDEAYEMALKLFEAQPKDEWVNRALFYTLYDKIKAWDINQDKDGLALWSKKVEQLKLPEDDDAINSCLVKIKRILDPNHDLLLQAKEFTKNSQYRKAVDIYKSIIAKYKEDALINESYGWALYRLAKEEFDKNPTNSRECKIILNDYLKLPNPRPSHLHSSILRLAMKLSDGEKLDFVAFVRLWDPGKLDNEDYQPFVSEGKTYPCLAEKAYQTLFKGLSKNPTREHIQYFSSYLVKAIETFPENIWLVYYKAKILTSLHEYDEALKFMISVLRKKSEEYWAWKYTGDILAESNDLGRAVSCYCKALLCPVEEEKVLRIRTDFVPLLVKSSLFTEAVIEVNKILVSNDNKCSKDVTHYLSAPWWDPKMDRSASNKKFYLEGSQIAIDLLHHDLAWHKAVFAEAFRTIQKNREMARLMIEVDPEKLTETVASITNIPILRKMAAGQPIKVKFTSESDRLNVMAVEYRTDGAFWDLLRSQIAVVDHVNPVKNVVHCIAINNGHYSHSLVRGLSHMLTSVSVLGGIIRVSSPKDLVMFHVGLPLEIKAISAKTSKCIVLDIMDYKILDANTIVDKLVTSFLGHISISDAGHGFVDHIFIHASMVSQKQIVDNEMVSGTAIRSFVDSKNAWGWMCVQIEKNN